MRDDVLYLIVCGAPPSRDAVTLVRQAQEQGWRVCVISTPAATQFIDAAELEAATGYPIRSEYKAPGTADLLPPPDAIVVAPATVNTINKWAAGICDTLATGILVEAIGKRLPTVALPFTNRAHAAHPAFVENIGRLRSWGVTVLFGPDVYPLHEPGTGSKFLHLFPWSMTLQALTDMTPRTGTTDR
jgi:phosphopantothenoylcysteine synthetase/decarboxylase